VEECTYFWGVNTSWGIDTAESKGPLHQEDNQAPQPTCLYGKQNRVRFPSGATRAEGILQLVHSDVFGPVSVPSLGKSMYYVSFIDDFSRKTWIYFLRKKSKVFDKFKEFKALVENQTEKQIKVLRTDNGGEFCENEFEEFCKKCGITR
jgi:hypothetical protein